MLKIKKENECSPYVWCLAAANCWILMCEVGERLLAAMWFFSVSNLLLYRETKKGLDP